MPGDDAAGHPPNPLVQGPDNEDRLTSTAMHTIAFDTAISDHATASDGQFERERVITTVSPVVVRQHALPDGEPRYQEALGYSFLINSPKYPGLCQMDDGSLILTLTAALTGETVVSEGVTLVDEETRDDVLLRSVRPGTQPLASVPTPPLATPTPTPAAPPCRLHALSAMISVAVTRRTA